MSGIIQFCQCERQCVNTPCSPHLFGSFLFYAWASHISFLSWSLQESVSYVCMSLPVPFDQYVYPLKEYYQNIFVEWPLVLIVYCQHTVRKGRDCFQSVLTEFDPEIDVLGIYLNEGHVHDANGGNNSSPLNRETMPVSSSAKGHHVRSSSAECHFNMTLICLSCFYCLFHQIFIFFFSFHLKDTKPACVILCQHSPYIPFIFTYTQVTLLLINVYQD